MLFDIFNFSKHFSSTKYVKGGSIETNLEKELHKLQRDLNSSRLRTYIEGDTSEEEKAREKERSVKLTRFNEVLQLLKEKDSSKYDKGGSLRTPKEFNALVASKQAIVKDLSPKEVADMWNEHAGPPSTPWTEADGAKDYAKMHLRNLLVEKELSEAEYNEYFEKGGLVKKKFTVTVRRTNWASTDISVEAANQQTAKLMALDKAGDIEFGSGEADYEVENVSEHN